MNAGNRSAKGTLLRNDKGNKGSKYFFFVGACNFIIDACWLPWSQRNVIKHSCFLTIPLVWVSSGGCAR